MLTIADFNSFWGFLGQPVHLCFLVHLIHTCMKISRIHYIFLRISNSHGNTACSVLMVMFFSW